jgi:cytochrome c
MSLARLPVGLVLALCLACARARPAPPEAPAEAPAFGFGRPPTPEEVRAWDIDVRPDGAGLPPGRGTVAQGAAIYAAKCAACHGIAGRNGPFSTLVGREPRTGFPFGRDPSLSLTIGNYWPYATTLYDYTYRAMPWTLPGSLEPEEVYALVAYLLFLNEIVPEDAVLDASTLPRIIMPARDRFVRDNRRGGSAVR